MVIIMISHIIEATFTIDFNIENNIEISLY